MPGLNIELHAVNRITVGTIGEPGNRMFLLQASDAVDTITLKMEKEQSRALAHAVDELLESLDDQYPIEESPFDIPLSAELMIREPAEPLFVIGQIGLGYDKNRDMIVLAVQELVLDETEEPSTARFWITRGQIKTLSQHALSVVDQGRPICPLCGKSMDPDRRCCPRVNGRYKTLIQQ